MAGDGAFSPPSGTPDQSMPAPAAGAGGAGGAGAAGGAAGGAGGEPWWHNSRTIGVIVGGLALLVLIVLLLISLTSDDGDDAGDTTPPGGSVPTDGGGSTPATDGGGTTPSTDGGGTTPSTDGGSSTPSSGPPDSAATTTVAGGGNGDTGGDDGDNVLTEPDGDNVLTEPDGEPVDGGLGDQDTSGRQVLIAGRIEPCRFGDPCLVASFRALGFPWGEKNYTCEFSDGSRYTYRFESTTVSYACATALLPDSITIEVDGVRSATIHSEDADLSTK